MRRSLEPRVPSAGELLFEVGGMPVRAQLVNVSRGGLCARGDLSQRVLDAVRSDPALPIALGLLDGTPPIQGSATLVWAAERDDGVDGPPFGLRFIDLSADDRARLDAAISARGEPAAREASRPPRGPLRLRLADGQVLRTEVTELDHDGAMLCAELPWLRVG